LKTIKDALKGSIYLVYIEKIERSNFVKENLILILEEIILDNSLSEKDKFNFFTYISTLIVLQDKIKKSIEFENTLVNGRIQCDREGKRDDYMDECAEERQASMEAAYIGSLISFGGAIASGPAFAIGVGIWGIGTGYAIYSVETTYNSCVRKCDIEYPCQ
jgi:hypothetical protein